MTHLSDPLAQAQYTSHQWLASVGEQLGTADRHESYRALRAWLHTLRDQLTVGEAARVATQLPELLRGTFFEGWDPGRVSARYELDEFTERFAREADIGDAEVPAAATAVSAAVRRLCTAGELDDFGSLLPLRLDEEWPAENEPATPPEASADQRLQALENSVDALISAVRALARGLEEMPVDEPLGNHAARGAREAHQILLAAGR